MSHAAQTVGRLVRELERLGVDPGLLQRVVVHLTPRADDPDAWGELAATMRRQRNYTAAERVYQIAFESFGTFARLWNNYGILLQEWGKLRESLAAFEQAIGLDASYSKPLTNKGKVLELLNEFVAARRCYQAALALDPTDVVATNNTGVCLLAEGDAAAAEQWFGRALDLDPEWADALFNLALLRLARNDYDTTPELLDRLERILPDDEQVGKMRRQLESQPRERMQIDVPRPLALDSHADPALRRLWGELTGNPRSIFISYAWPDPSTKAFAARLCRDLQKAGFQVVLDQNLGLDVAQMISLLPQCQNVVVLNDAHYVESCLLGKLPITKTTSIYPSFAFPMSQSQSSEYLGMVFKISAVAWETAKQIKQRGGGHLDTFAFEVANPDAFKEVPGLRMFVEGWRVDEIQMVFANLRQFRSISIVYLSGEHCLAGYPLFDFSNESYYKTSFTALRNLLQSVSAGKVDHLITATPPDWSRHPWPDSSIASAKLWKIAEEDVAVWRPSVTPAGDVAAVVTRFKDWTPA